jgi:hypothetical protein
VLSIACIQLFSAHTERHRIRRSTPPHHRSINLLRHHHPSSRLFYPTPSYSLIINLSISMGAPSSPYHYNSIYTTDPSSSSSSSSYPYSFNTLSYYPPQLTERQKLEQDFENGFPDDDFQSFAQPSNSYSSIPVNPHINFHRAPDPTSPVTIATSISTHSTPASSPSRVAIMSSDHSPLDFQLYDDDGFPISIDQKPRMNRRYESPFGSRNSPTPHSRPNIYTIGASQPESSVAQPRLQIYYPKQPQQFLQAPSQRYSNQPLAMARAQQVLQHHSDDDEPPALSPHHQFSTSSRLSMSDVDLHSPITPIASPESVHGEGCGASASAIRMEAYDHGSLYSWTEQYLRSQSEVHTPVPKLGPRTISDAMQDDLYNHGVATGTAHSAQQPPVCTAPSTLPILYQQAQKQHTMSTPTLPRDHSPFRANSPYHPACGVQLSGFSIARAQREQGVEIERAALQRQMQENYNTLRETPKTISPKDAYLEYHEPSQEGIRGSLFAQEDEYSQNGSVHSGSYKGSVHEDDEDAQTEQSYSLKREGSFGSMATSRRESDASMSYTGSVLSPNGSQQYKPLGIPYGYSEISSRHSEEPSDPTSQQPIAEGERDYDCQPISPPVHKPSESKANRGVYTCTVFGCTQRFPTTNKMAKHRREAHRQTTPGSRGDGISKSHHPGPHKCTRINPTTNKPCNTVFSRPYDLTRHEDTIHNTHREKVRCEICNDEKTFSRQDALTRHKKVIHSLFDSEPKPSDLLILCRLSTVLINRLINNQISLFDSSMTIHDGETPTCFAIKSCWIK